MKTENDKKALTEIYSLDVSQVPEDVESGDSVTVSCFLHGQYEVKWNTLRKRRTGHSPGCQACRENKVNLMALDTKVRMFKILGIEPPEWAETSQEQ